MKFQGVIFDLDGTLLNSLEDIADSMNNVLKKLKLPTHDLEEYKYFVGAGMYKLVTRAVPEELRQEDFLKSCFEMMRQEYSRNWRNKTKPYEGIPELLDYLTSLNMAKAVLSNKPHDSTVIMVKELLADWDFQMVLGARPGVPKKPDPVGALEIARKLKIPPERFLYLGDTNIDMQTANAAGMYPVGVLWGFRKSDELIKSGAKALIGHPLELKQNYTQTYDL